jgi:hypothetical protein
MRHVRHQILDHPHGGQRIDPHITVDFIDGLNARQGVAAINVHRTRPTDALAAGTPESQCRVDLVFDLDQGVEHHRATGIEIHLVGVETRVFPLVRLPAVDLEGPGVTDPVRRLVVFALLDPGIGG